MTLEHLLIEGAVDIIVFAVIVVIWFSLSFVSKKSTEVSSVSIIKEIETGGAQLEKTLGNIGTVITSFVGRSIYMSNQKMMVHIKHAEEEHKAMLDKISSLESTINEMKTEREES